MKQKASGAKSAIDISTIIDIFSLMSSAADNVFIPPRFGSLKRAATWFRALGDATRLQIIQRLSEGERCVCELTDLLEAKQPLLSFHLKTLKEAGILNGRRDGRWIYYSLNPEAVETLEQFLGVLKERKRKLRMIKRCCD